MQTPPGSTIVLISGDGNFFPEIREAVNLKNHRIVLFHGKKANRDLVSYADEAIVWEDFAGDTPNRINTTCLLITGFQVESSQMSRLERRISSLVENTGGKVIKCHQTAALVSFPTEEQFSFTTNENNGAEAFHSHVEFFGYLNSNPNIFLFSKLLNSTKVTVE